MADLLPDSLEAQAPRGMPEPGSGRKRISREPIERSIAARRLKRAWIVRTIHAFCSRISQVENNYGIAYHYFGNVVAVRAVVDLTARRIVIGRMGWFCRAVSAGRRTASVEAGPRPLAPHPHGGQSGSGSTGLVTQTK